VQELVKAGCNPWTQGCGAQAFHIAVNMDKNDVFDYFSKLDGFIVDSLIQGSGASAFTLATQFGNVSMMEKLLLLGADINRQTDSGTTALMIASRTGNKDLVKYLLDKGAKKELVDKNGKGCVGYAKDAAKAGGLPDAKRIVKLLTGDGSKSDSKSKSKSKSKKSKKKKTAEPAATPVAAATTNDTVDKVTSSLERMK